MRQWPEGWQKTAVTIALGLLYVGAIARGWSLTAIALALPVAYGWGAKPGFFTLLLALVLRFFWGAETLPVLVLDGLVTAVALSWMTLQQTAIPSPQPALVSPSLPSTPPRTPPPLPSLLQNLPFMVIALDDDGRLVFWNRAGQTLFGYSANEMLGQADGLTRLLPDTTLRSQFLNKWRNHVIIADADWLLQTRNNQTKMMVWHDLSIHYPVAGWMAWGVGLDVTEQRETEAQLRHLAIRADTLALFSQTLANTHVNYQVMLETITQRVSELLGGMCGLSLIRGKGQVLELASLYHPDPAKMALLKEGFFIFNMTYNTQISQVVVENGYPLLIAKVPPQQAKSWLPPDQKNLMEQFPINSLLLVPLKYQAEIIGILGLARDDGESYTLQDQLFLQSVAEQAAAAITNGSLYQTMRQELSERLLAQEALQVSEELYRSLIEQSNDAIYLLFLDRRQFVHVNRRFLEMFSLQEEDVADPALSMWDLVAPESLDVVELRRESGMKGEEISPYYEFVGLTRDGRRLAIEASVSYVQYQGKTAVQGILRDVTERKKTEAALQKQTSELEAIAQISNALRMAHSIEEMLPLVLEKAIEAVGGRIGTVYLLNAEGTELILRGTYPYNPEHLGRRISATQGITGHVAQSESMLITQKLSGELFLPDQSPAEFVHDFVVSLPLRSQDQPVGAMNIIVAEANNLGESETRLLSAFADIAGGAIERAMILETLEYRVAERTYDLASANERLSELDRLKSQFVSDVSHELRTPVTNLKLYLELLAHGRPTEHERYMMVLKNQTERLEELIKQVLTITRLDLSRATLKFAPVDFNQLVTQTVLAHRPRAEAAHLEMVFEPAPYLPTLWGVATHLSEMIDHLLKNALIYTFAGKITLQTLLDEKKQEVCFRISDTGMGMEEGDLPHLFERFYRGQRVTQLNIPGTGLGLSIVKEIVDAHKGRIDVVTELDKGSVFTVYLPIAE